MTEPTRDTSGQLPAFASASEHGGTPAIFASMPGGSDVVSPASPWSASEREKDSTNGEEAPARGLGVAPAQLGEKPLTQPAEIWKGIEKLAGDIPLQGLSEAPVVNVPQLSGVTSAPRGPPKRPSLSSPNGSCGLSSNVVVIWPVARSSSTCPASLTSAPSASAVT